MPIWNKEAECASPEARQKLQLERLQKSVERVYSRVPFYRKKLDEAGVTPDSITSLKDIAKLPFTTKYELRETYPYGLLACDKSLSLPQPVKMPRQLFPVLPAQKTPHVAFLVHQTALNHRIRPV